MMMNSDGHLSSILGVQATSLPPSILMDSPRGLNRACSPAAKQFDEIYTVKQPYKIHIDV